MIGKCDMRHSRLGSQAPACVSAAPPARFRWRSSRLTSACGGHERYHGTRYPSGPEHLVDPGHTAGESPAEFASGRSRPFDDRRSPLAARHHDRIHAALVGAFATIWLLQLLGASARLGAAALTSLLVGALALAASTLHLGRPIHAYRAVKMWKRSWLSREVLLFAAFSAVACLYAGAPWLELRGGAAIGALTVLFGLGGVGASAYIYRVPSRPAWNSPFTLVQFILTAATLGLLFAAAAGAGDSRWLAVTVATVAGVELVILALRFFRLSASDRVELQATARLLATTIASRLVMRGVRWRRAPSRSAVHQPSSGPVGCLFAGAWQRGARQVSCSSSAPCRRI